MAVEQPPTFQPGTAPDSHKKYVFRKISKPAEGQATFSSSNPVSSANGSSSTVQKTITGFVTPTTVYPKPTPPIFHPPPTAPSTPRDPSPLSFVHRLPARSPPVPPLTFCPADQHRQPVSPSTDRYPETCLPTSQSNSKLPTTLCDLRAQRLSVMDDICNVLSEISTLKFNELFGTAADTLRKNLAKRKLLLSRELELLKQQHQGEGPQEEQHQARASVSSKGGYKGDYSTPKGDYRTPKGDYSTTTPNYNDDIENFDDDDMIAAWSEIERDEKPKPHDNVLSHHHQPPSSLPQHHQPPSSLPKQHTTRPTVPIATVPPLSVHPSSPSFSSSAFQAPPTLSRSTSSPSTSHTTTTPTALSDQFPQHGVNANGAAEFRKSYPHSHEMMKLFTKVFGLRQFRMNQLEAMNASILGNDCFVLMPTGGGKSLCYQLPALLQPGVTVVVSPLRSLIQDQVQKLHSLEVPAQQLCGDNPYNDTIYGFLAQRQLELKLLYVTPEKLGASNKLLSALQSLYTRGMLARFVIDEAHCISQWGHDFRPDYKRLNELRVKFPDVPIMAVTATATPRVQADVVLQLRLRDTKWFTQSFNRPNLKFSVLPKRQKKVNEEIIKLINESFKNKSGIVYCLSRRDCEVVAGELVKAGIAALCYHAGLSDEERISVQQRWAQEDRCKVVCATIAFGMGIDKPDVRFVVHHSLPKSIEGYYQEAGRAGRDGRTASCVLYYNYADMARIRRMIESDGHSAHHKVDLDNLYRMVQYCENQTDCRRKQLLGYFAEKFDPSACKKSSAPCDNCTSSVPYHDQDVTELAKKVIESIRGCREQFTLVQCLEAIKGSASQKSARCRLSSLPLHGCGASMTKHDLERMLHLMVLEGFLSESLQIGSHDNVVCYVQIGPKHSQVLSGGVKVVLPVRGKALAEGAAGGSNQKRGTGEEDLTEDCYQALLQLRGRVAQTCKVQNPVNVFTTETLREMAQSLPGTEEDMMAIVGMTDVKWRNFEGEKFLEVTREFGKKAAALESKESPYWKGKKSCAKKRKKDEVVIVSPPVPQADHDFGYDDDDDFLS